MKKPDNIREFVWQIIDTDLSLKKDIAREIINVRSLANYILSRYKVNISIDSVISAIRRYNIKPEKEAADVYALLKKAKIRTITKMASLSLKKNEEVTSNLGRVLPEVNFEGGEVLRVIEGAKLFKIIIDATSYEKMQNRFGKRNILESRKGIGIVEITYPDILKETPGVFAAISTELGANDISIIDALIISNE
ncbi:MAG: hypothetical protein KJ601_02280, partial [Nanoarchaeota archaeon]|nr:hypothetical protein [Nanoarchaeota archaeon]